MLSFLLDHLWQSTWIALGIAILALLVRNNGAHIRYWLWLAASVKFLLPLSLVMYAGSQIAPLATGSAHVTGIDRWAEATFAPTATRDRDIPAVTAVPTAGDSVAGTTPGADQPSRAPASSGILPLLGWLVGGLWLAGCMTVVSLWFARWLRLRHLVRSGAPLQIAGADQLPLPVLEAISSIEPGVVGVIRPVLLLPKGIVRHLSTAQLQAVLMHELTHWRRRDNLTATIHMLVEAVFWFHPLVWWIGAQLVRERERACDEATVRLVETPEVYAEGILNVCQYYVAPPRLAASAISGGDLKRRIETIVANLAPEAMHLGKKVLIGLFAVGVVGGPFLLGGIEPIAAQPATEAQPAATNRPSVIESLYGVALQEGSVNVMAFDPRDATWIAQAFNEAFPGITVDVRSSLGHLPMIISDARSARPTIDVVQTSLIEGNALYEEGYLARTAFDAFGVPASRAVLNSSFAYTNSIVYTVVYDSRRVGVEPEIPPLDPDSPNRIPATWRDLLDASYAGKISTNPFVMPRAIAALGTVWGVSAAEDYARRLAGDQQLLSSFGDAKGWFLNESRPQMYYLAQVNTLTVQWDDQNLPSDYVVPEPILIEQQGTAVMASAPHPAAAALLSGWLASPEGVATRKRVAYTADLLPDSNDELARELRSRGTEIVYDTPATTGLRGELAAAIQPLIGPEYNFYERNAQPRSTTFPSTPASPTAIIGQAIEELMRKLQSVPD